MKVSKDPNSKKEYYSSTITISKKKTTILIGIVWKKESRKELETVY